MGKKIISQREARRLRKRVEELERAEARRWNMWAQDYPGGTHFWTVNLSGDATPAAIGTAAKLGHAIVAKIDGSRLMLYAIREKEGE